MSDATREVTDRLSLAQIGAVLEDCLAALEGGRRPAPGYVVLTDDGRVEIGAPTDLHSVGRLASALCTGRSPRAEGPLALWIEWLLSEDPADRPQSPREARAALEAILVAVLGPAWRSESAIVTRTRRRRTLPAAIAAAAAAVAITAGAFAAQRPSPAPAAPTGGPLFVGGDRDGLRTGARETAVTLRSSELARVLSWLERRERTLAPALDGPNRTGATKRLWWAYVGAAKRLRAVDVAPADRGVRRDLAEAIRLAGCAYGRAAGHPERVTRERRVVLVQQANARQASYQLAAAGYRLPPGVADFTRLWTNV